MARYERQLRGMSRTVLVADDRRAALTLVAARAREAADGDLGAVLVRDRDGDDVVISAHRRGGRRLAELELPSQMAADVLASTDLRPMLLDISAGPGARELPREYQQMGPVMVVPVGLAKKSHGALLIAKRASEGHFSESDLRLLTPFAAEASLAIAFAVARRELERGVLAKDRGRIARELHDGVIQSLYGIGMVLEGIQGGSPQTGIKIQLSGITSSINTIIDDLRAYIHDLTPSRLAKRGLGFELSLLAHEFEAGSGVLTSVRLEEGTDEIAAGLARDLVQISREALSNVAKHAEASSVVISLDCTRAGIMLVIADDGHGISAHRRAGGRGLSNIMRRAESWGGDAEIGSSGRRGTSVRVFVPGRGERHASAAVSMALFGGQLFSASAFGAMAASLAS
jgi:two-component system, NarL family, sensor histidine kinase DevS